MYTSFNKHNRLHVLTYIKMADRHNVMFIIKVSMLIEHMKQIDHLIMLDLTIEQVQIHNPCDVQQVMKFYYNRRDIDHRVRNTLCVTFILRLFEKVVLDYVENHLMMMNKTLNKIDIRAVILLIIVHHIIMTVNIHMVVVVLME